MLGDVSITTLTPADVLAVDQLRKENSDTLGFLPLAVLQSHVDSGTILGAMTGDNRLAAYLLYASYPERFRIVHLCVSEQFRGHRLARRLIDELVAKATTQRILTLHCRNDFPAHHMWPALSFIPESEKPGRSREGHLLTHWRRTLTRSDQLSLFRARTSEDTFDLVIDAQVFFDFSEPHNDLTLPSHALLNDSLIDTITIWHTDELLREINRNLEPEAREQARRRASGFLRLEHDPLLFDTHVEGLRTILPYRTDQEKSDVHHLAMTAASDVKIFVSRDGRLLKNAGEIQELTGVRVLTPTQLLLEVQQRSTSEPPLPDRIGGPSVEWRPFSSADRAQFPWNQFLHSNERNSQLRTRVDALVADTKNSVEILWAEDKPLALRILEDQANSTTVIHLVRVSTSRQNYLERGFVAQFVLIDSLKRSLRMRRHLVQFSADAFPLGLVTDLGSMGFTKAGDTYSRFSFTRFLEREQLLKMIDALQSDSTTSYTSMDEYDLQRSCSPAVTGDHQTFLMLPIKPAYARNLVDRQQAASLLFGNDSHLLMSWSNVYYRKAYHQKLIRPPAKILWYASSPQKELVAISDLQAVAIDTPRELLRRFSRYGTLEWSHLFEMVGGDTQEKLMALIFTGTFELNNRIPLADVWNVFSKHGLGQSIQGPRRLPFAAFCDFLELGYPE